MIVYGINPVLEALRAGRVRRLRVARSDRRIDEALTLARELRVPVERVDVQVLGRVARGGAHQGIAADLAPPRDYSLEELVTLAAPEPPLIVVLDGIEDPHNVGAIIRTADAAGCHGIVRQQRHAASLARDCGQGVGRRGGPRQGGDRRERRPSHRGIEDAECMDCGTRSGFRCVISPGGPDAPDRPGARSRGHRSAAIGARALRPARLDPDVRRCR